MSERMKSLKVVGIHTLALILLATFWNVHFALFLIILVLYVLCNMFGWFPYLPRKEVSD